MRVQYRTEGGIAAGLRRRLDIDTDEKTITIGITDRIIGTDDLTAEETNELGLLIIRGTPSLLPPQTAATRRS